MDAYNGNRQSAFPFQLGFVHMDDLVLIATIVHQDGVKDSLMQRLQ
jgi:hypothetical protein